MVHGERQPPDLRGCNALIVGGSRGLGLQMAQALGQAGARVMLGARQIDALERAVAQLQDAGIDARWCAADACRPDGIAHLVGETLQRMGEIDILVAHAALDCRAPDTRQTAPADGSAALGCCLQLCQAVARASMLGRRRGRIILAAPLACVLSGGMADALPDRLAGLGQLTRALARRWRRYGIGVNAVCSGLAPDGRHAATLAAQGASVCGPDAFWLPGGAGDPLGRLTQLLASDAGQRITGRCLALNLDRRAAAPARR